MTKPLQLKRVFLLLGVLVAAFAGLGYRLVDLQVVRHDELLAKAQNNTHREIWTAPRRGDILDVRGNLLATSVPVKTICADPTLIGNQQLVVARALSPLLNVSEGELYQKLLPRAVIGKNENGETVTNISHYVRLQKNIPEETWRQIQVTMTNLAFGLDETKLSKTNRAFLAGLRKFAISAEPDQMRVYPNGPLAAQVLGFSGVDEFRANNHLVTQISGRDGIEWSMNKTLSGVAGWRVTENDGKHRELVALREQDVQPRDGLNVVLTLDAAIQNFVEVALADAMQKHTPKSITGIVMRPRTGEILAMVTLPNYDPNKPNTITPELRNRAITDVIEPGSTFKVVVVSGALNENLVKLTDTFDCEHGQFFFAGKPLRDHESYGLLTTERIITKSSNIGAAKIGIKLGEKTLYDYAYNFGFGQYSGITLPGEVKGILHPVNKWTKVSIAQIPMGQGVSVTRLQMVMAMGALANNGWLMQPMIVNRLEDRDGSVVQRYAPQRVRQVVSEATSKQMIEALKTVVTKDGTAPGAAMAHYTAAGKTGTAQKPENGGYAPGKYVSSFIGFFPADEPELCISIVMDEPKEGYYGGAVCGPVFKDIAERCASYLNIPPDKTLTTTNAPASIMATAQPNLRTQ
jgi:cell division protein FtsI/penicillin-binding protein 2